MSQIMMKNPYSSTRKLPEEEDALKSILIKLRPFQRQAYDFAIAHQGKILLADEMGLGKTVTALAIMTCYQKDWPLLILCPASLRYTWPCEIEKFLPSISPRSVKVIQGFDDVQIAGYDIVVATYSLLQTRSAVAQALLQQNFKSVICDESHNLKERNTQRSQLALPILKQAQHLLLLSGTPALARPVELWLQLTCLSSEFGSYSAFTKQYCNAHRGRFGWDVSGISNAQELHAKLKTIMVRRLKSQVLTELPAKQRSMVPIEVVSGESRLSMQELQQARSSGNDFEARRLFMQAYQATGIAKSKAVAEYVLDWLAGSGTQKLLVFGHHKEVLDVLERAVSKKYKGRGHVRIDGTVSSKERSKRVHKFQNSASIKVAILSMTAAGVGLTLTAASSVVFAELFWTPGVLVQAEDRCHRIGQANAVHVMYCIAKDESCSVDSQLWALLGRKVGNLGKIIDGNKSASMEAKDIASRPNNQNNSSEEDELVRFFAETSTDESSGNSSAPPVKGSILSFFQKTPKNSTSNSTRGDNDLEVNSNVERLAATTKPRSTKATRDRPREGPFVEWACEACTFENSKRKPPSGYLACQMCATPYFHLPDDEAVLSSPASHHEAIEIIDSDDEIPSIPPRRPNNTPSAEREVIELDTTSAPTTVVIDDADESVGIVTPAESSKSSFSQPAAPSPDKPPSLLQFCVSPNSGRVLLYSGKRSLCHGFDIEQVLTKETNEKLMNATGKRSLDRQMFQVSFCNESVLKVIRELKGLEFSGNSEQQCMEEVKLFVRAYISLREVEKRELKSWGKPVASTELRKRVAILMASKRSESFTERYAGGAKEQAREKAKSGSTLSATDKAVIDGTACAWCGGTLSAASLTRGVESTYCSQSCAEEGRLRRGGMYASTRVRAQLFELEGGVCQKCGMDAHAFFNRITSLRPAERLNALCNANWRLPSGRAGVERLLQNPKEGDFWQADHIVAVVEGGGGCGLDNLRTLCVPCHKLETERLRGRLKLNARSMNDARTKRTQLDIRTSFFSPAQQKKVKHANDTSS